MKIESKTLDDIAREMAQDEAFKAACRDVFYENVRLKMNAANQPSFAGLLDLVRGTHRLQEVLWE